MFGRDAYSKIFCTVSTLCYLYGMAIPVQSASRLMSPSHLNKKTVNHTWKEREQNYFYEEEYSPSKKRPASYESYENFLPAHSNKKTKAYQNSSNIHNKKKAPAKKAKGKKKKNINRKLHYIKHKVKKGDTLIGISKKYNVPISKICSVNGMKNKNRIMKGTILKIPIYKSIPQKKYPANAPRFAWPMKRIINYKKDEINGVKPIGIIITSNPYSPVLSSAPGTVKKIGQMRGFGRYIVITHNGRFATVYANLESVYVSVGDTINTGQVIGKITSEKRLHFQIDFQGKPENPLEFLPKKI